MGFVYACIQVSQWLITPWTGPVPVFLWITCKCFYFHSFLPFSFLSLHSRRLPPAHFEHVSPSCHQTAGHWCGHCHLHHRGHVLRPSQLCGLSGGWEVHQGEAPAVRERLRSCHLLAGQLHLGHGEMEDKYQVMCSPFLKLSVLLECEWLFCSLSLSLHC